MQVKFWGVRGSTPIATSGILKYGGNTSCVEVRTAGGQLIILDAGSGIRALGQELVQEANGSGRRIELFLTHYHWDHIQGFPFFEPMYAEGNHVHVHGFTTKWGSVESALGDQMANPYFPVSMSVMRATRELSTIGEETVKVGDAVVTTRRLNHPQSCLGYRISDGKGTLVYATDNEPGDRECDENLRKLCDGADVLVYDSQYTVEEYRTRAGWGHSTWKAGVDIANECGVKELILFHHDPDHRDYVVDSIVREARDNFPTVHAAREGMQIDLSRLAEEPSYKAGFEKRYNARHSVPLPLMIRLHDVETHEEYTLVENISLDGAYFFAKRPLQAGSEIELEIGLQATDNEIGAVRASARVVRSELVGDRVGVAITFR